MADPAPTSLALKEFNDIELLSIVADLTDTESGWASAELVADRCGLEHPNPIRCVAVRMSWMQRYGAVEHNPDEPYFYRLTDEGEALIGKKGYLTVTQRRALESVRDEQRLNLMQEIAISFGQASPLAATLMRRHWTHRMTGRRWR
jgi:hypothetical protein